MKYIYLDKKKKFHDSQNVIMKPHEKGMIQRTTLQTGCLTHKWCLSQHNLVGFKDKLTLGFWWETLVQQQHLWTVCGTRWIPPCSSTQSSTAAPTVPNVAHLNAEGKLVA